MNRKIVFGLMVTAAMLSSTALADGFDTLVFKSMSGESYSVNTDNLEIYFKDGNLSFNNDEQVIPAASLLSMEFADKSGNGSGVGEIAAADAGPVEVYSLEGVRAGEFSTLAEAGKNLQPGVYAVRCQNGVTFKVRITR